MAPFAPYAQALRAIVLQPRIRLFRRGIAMAVSGLSGIESMLSQMRAVVRAAQSGGATEAELAPGPSGFAAELQRSIRSVSQAQNAASDQAKAFELGAPGISLNDVMIDLQKASLGFQTSVQVRNRLVAAYKEISSMAV
ncbi:flagellar hook-basal body complex protein FliE [Bordetella pertussis]|nr:flagellar hook-basal body complex protein FliE [Bordetella pertussis]